MCLQQTDSILTVAVPPLADTLVTVVRQAGNWVAWAVSGATVILTGALVYVTNYWAKRTHAVTLQMQDLQREHTRLQREFNKREAERDDERRKAQADALTDRQRALDDRISASAFVARWYFVRWLESVPDALVGDRVGTVFEALADWTDAVSSGGSPTLNVSNVRMAHHWAGSLTKQFAAVESVLRRITEDAPEATDVVSAAVQRAYILYYQAKGHVDKWVSESAPPYDRARETIGYLIDAHRELVECEKAIIPAIRPALRVTHAFRDVRDLGSVVEDMDVEPNVSPGEPDPTEA